MAEQTGSSEADYAALVRGLLDDLSGTAITRLELRRGDLRVLLRRTPGQVALAYQPSHATAPGPVEDGRPEHWHAVTAPLTGIFYTRPAPDQDPYVIVGSHVEADHVVGLIETMKMFNEVTPDVTGTVREVLLENGSLVQSGQALMYVEPGEDLQGPPVMGG